MTNEDMYAELNEVTKKYLASFVKGIRSEREIWEYNRELERLEGVRRCTYCGAREDRHNESADMAYYEYKAHVFQYPSGEKVAEWRSDAIS